MRPLRLLAFMVGMAVAGPALADRAPVFVVPTRPGVPVVINGVDASYAVVEGDWGLDRPGAAPARVTSPNWRFYTPGSARYFPSAGQTPGYGRLERNPPPGRPLPPQAESYFRQYYAGSQMIPAADAPPMQPPAVILAPRDTGEEGSGHGRRPPARHSPHGHRPNGGDYRYFPGAQ